MPKYTDNKGKWDKFKGKSGVSVAVLTEPTQIYFDDIGIVKRTEYKLYKTLVLASGKKVEYDTVCAMDLTPGDISELQTSGYSVIQVGSE